MEYIDFQANKFVLIRRSGG